MDDMTIDREFADHVRTGLGGERKRLFSRYFYDDLGDRLFQEIMASPEYYLTDCELEILRQQSPAIAGEIARGGAFELVELGAGDGSKICHLLDALHHGSHDFSYRPIDISSHVLTLLEARLCPDRPWLNLRPLAANYTDWLREAHDESQRRVFAFLGSNLGNFSEAEALLFLRAIRSAMGPGDALLIGLDLKKDPEIIRAAYDDKQGVTAQFNLNLLQRINRELGGHFDTTQFAHAPEYDPVTGAARSFLRSLCRQQVPIDALSMTVDFEEGERIFMEISQKYDDALIGRLTAQSGFEVDVRFMDRQGWFTDQVWRPTHGGDGRK